MISTPNLASNGTGCINTRGFQSAQLSPREGWSRADMLALFQLIFMLILPLLQWLAHQIYERRKHMADSRAITGMLTSICRRYHCMTISKSLSIRPQPQYHMRRHHTIGHLAFASSGDAMDNSTLFNNRLGVFLSFPKKNNKYRRHHTNIPQDLIKADIHCHHSVAVR
jgi:hypothetical protein